MIEAAPFLCEIRRRGRCKIMWFIIRNDVQVGDVSLRSSWSCYAKVQIRAG